MTAPNVTTQLNTLSTSSTVVQSIPGNSTAEQQANELHAIKVDDYRWKLKARKRYGFFFATLLCLQNMAVYCLIFRAFKEGRLNETPAVYAFMITGTLGETYLIIKIIVQWLFSDIKYTDNRSN